MSHRLLARFGDADLWLLDLRATVESLGWQWAILSPRERGQADAMARPGLRRAAVAARAGLREVLAPYRAAAPGALEFHRDRGGKPWLEGGPHFSLSRSSDLGLCAVSARREVGVDLERVRPIDDPDGLACRVLGRADLAAYLADRDGALPERFLRYWTGREAYLKALGVGLPGLELAGDRDPRSWSLQALAPAPGYVGALVVERPAAPGPPPGEA